MIAVRLDQHQQHQQHQGRRQPPCHVDDDDNDSSLEATAVRMNGNSTTSTTRGFNVHAAAAPGVTTADSGSGNARTNGGLHLVQNQPPQQKRHSSFEQESDLSPAAVIKQQQRAQNSCFRPKNHQHHHHEAPQRVAFLPGNNHHQDQNDAGKTQTSRPSNERLLAVAFFTFLTFALVQLVFAFIAGSQAMKGDSAAMLVDSLTYLFNWIAERKKHAFDENAPTLFQATDPTRARRIRKREKRKLVLRMEITPPFLSVLTLVAVTIVVLHKSIGILILDAHRDRAQQQTPNLNLMLTFSCLNLLLDGVNVIEFARANHLFGYRIVEEDEIGRAYSRGSDTDGEDNHSNSNHSMGGAAAHPHRAASTDSCDDDQDLILQVEDGKAGVVAVTAGSSSLAEAVAATTQHHHHHPSSSRNNNTEEQDEEERTNLNMCSAYTHVFADTLRSLAVIIAAGIAESLDAVTSEVADAAAAVVVSFLILLSLIPLFQGMWLSFAELRAIQAEEQSEAMFLHQPTTHASIPSSTNPRHRSIT